MSGPDTNQTTARERITWAALAGIVAAFCLLGAGYSVATQHWFGVMFETVLALCAVAKGVHWFSED